MIGNAVLYAASRATSTAVENISRRVTWTAIAAVLFCCGLVFALVAALWLAQPHVGSVYAAGAIAVGCIAIGIACLFIPSAIEWAERKRRQETSTVAVVQEEAKEAVDYFGALQVVGAAFLFGLGTARRLRR